MFEPPDLDNVAQESGCWKTAHFAVENTEIVGDFFHQKKEKEMHWFPEALLKKGHCCEIVSLVRDSTIQNSNTTPGSRCPKLKLEVSDLLGTHTLNHKIW